MSAVDGRTARVIGTRMGTWTRVVRLWDYRELLLGLVRKELKVKYKNSVLGFLWSLVNPLLYLVVFYVAFQLILGAGIPNFPIYLLSGLLVWNLFSTGLGGATGSITGNAGIVGKVDFPREILPFAAIGAALVHFFLQASVLAAALVAFRWDVDWAYVWLVIPALLVLLLFTASLGLLLSAVNVYLRDTQHFLELALLAWFWMTPIVYQYMLIGQKEQWAVRLYQCNPVTAVVLAFQRGIYGKVEVTQANGDVLLILPPWGQATYLAYLGIVALVSLAVLVLAFWVFGRAEGNFAEEL